MSGVAQLIKSMVSMEAVANHYGFHRNQSGYINCPFHQEKTPSLKIYSEIGKGFHCFGCNAGGSVIDFVMQLFQLNLHQTIIRMNADFNLSIISEAPDRRQLDKFNREQVAKRKAEQIRMSEIQQLTEDHCRLWNMIKDGPAWSDEWCDALIKISYTDYRWEVATCQTNYTQLPVGHG